MSLTSSQIFSRTFEDVDEVGAAMAGQRPHTRIDQLSLSPFKVRIDQADFGDLFLFFAHLDSSSVHHIGDRRDGFVHFATDLTVAHPPGLTYGRPLSSNTLFGFDGNRGADSIIRAHSLISDVQIPRDLFMATCRAMRRDDLDDSFFRRDWLYSREILKVYQTYLRELLHLIKIQSPLLSQPEYRQIILGDLIPILIDAIPQQTTSSLPTEYPSQRARLARRARDYIHAHLNQPLTLKDIYTALGTSRRTLYYSFESIFGMTPIDYLKAQRLQGVRRSLKQADPRATAIKKIANQWGFWSLNHFAKDYRAQFGELPSETLKQWPTGRSGE